MKTLGDWAVAGAVYLVVGLFVLWIGWEVFSNLFSMPAKERGYVIGSSIALMVVVWHVAKTRDEIAELKRELASLRRLMERREN